MATDTKVPTTRLPAKEPEIVNPFYAGATPGMEAKALARPVKKAKQEDDGDESSEPSHAQSSI